MLKIWYRGGNINVVNNAPRYFDAAAQQEWFDDQLVKQMIQDVDKSEVAGSNLIISPVLGPIPPMYLSGGVKVLILMLKDNKYIYNMSNCGDNCAKWVLEIAKKKDLVVYLEHVMKFSGEFEIEILNTGKIVHNMFEYVRELRKVSNMVEVGEVPEATFI